MQSPGDCEGEYEDCWDIGDEGEEDRSATEAFPLAEGETRYCPLFVHCGGAGGGGSGFGYKVGTATSGNEVFTHNDYDNTSKHSRANVK